MKIKYKPNGYQDVTAYLVVNNAEAVSGYWLCRKSFDATLSEKMKVHDKIMHAEIFSLYTLPIQKVNCAELGHVILTKSFYKTLKPS